jgi:hypothetical chaperone protein
VSRNFGADVTYKVPFGSNVLGMPKHVIEQLCSPANLSILRRADVADFLRNVRSWSLGPEDKVKLDQLKILVDDALGFSLFESIEHAKHALSTADAADVDFSYPSIEVHEHVTRSEFEDGARRDTDAILSCLDRTLSNASIAAPDVELVCCTGGTAKVPIIAAEIRRRFGDGRVQNRKSFHSVVEGLAVHARGIARGEG